MERHQNGKVVVEVAPKTMSGTKVTANRKGSRYVTRSSWLE